MESEKEKDSLYQDGHEAEECFDRRPIFRRSLNPLLILLKIFGLYFDYSSNCKMTKKWKVIVKVYCYVMMLIRFCWFVFSIIGIFYHRDSSDLYISIFLLVFYLKCMAQSFACIMLSPVHKTCSLWSFIEELEVFLSDIKLSKCKKSENKFAKKLRMWLYVFTIICVGNILLQAVPLTNHNIGGGQLYNITSAAIRPLPMKVGFSILSIFINTICFGAWFLPAALCGVLSQCICYTYDELYRLMHNLKNSHSNSTHTMCLGTYIRCLRLKYVKISSMVQTLDNMVKHIYVVSYLLDISIICIILRLVIYTFTGIAARLFLCAWILPPLFTLVALSHYSSQIVDKGEQMHALIQDFRPCNVNADVQVELEMLMFHLTNQPAVMTIYGMIPLYKSIIISIFVTIITYFALLISL